LVEQAMFFLAGLLVAGVAGLLVLPAFARRALRLAEARARMLAPLSMKEVVAERDSLRAEHAIEQHRLDRRIAALQEAVGRHRADLGRQAAMLVELESGAARMSGDIADLHGELATRRGDILSLEGDLGASRVALNDFSAQLDGASSEISSLRERRVALETLTDEQRAVIAGLETRASGLEMKLDDFAQTAKVKAGAAEAERARLSSELAARTNEVAKLGAGLDEAMKKGATMVAYLEKKDAELLQLRRRPKALSPTIKRRTPMARIRFWWAQPSPRRATPLCGRLFRGSPPMSRA
jgi:DNA repair exonuclease SbcCD ATPase subunit